MYNVVRAGTVISAVVALVFTAACEEGYKTVSVHPEGDSRSPLLPGDSVQLVAVLLQNEVFFPFASSLRPLYDSQERPSEFRWSSADTTIATVSSDGKARVRRPGSTSIRARTQGVTGDLLLIVE
jgi:hypothetical protein